MSVPTEPKPSGLWIVDREQTEEHWLQVKDGLGWWQAFAKQDGCVEVTRFFNSPSSDESSIHICDLDEFIARLERLRELAREHFGEGWH